MSRSSIAILLDVLHVLFCYKPACIYSWQQHTSLVNQWISIFDRLGVDTRAAAITAAAEFGWL